MKKSEQKPGAKKKTAVQPEPKKKAASSARAAAPKASQASKAGAQKKKAKAKPAQPKKAAAKPAKSAGRVRAFFTSPAITVNAVMEWLNEKLGLKIPTLPLSGWPAVLKSLWEMFIKGTYPSGPLPWKISIDGSWPAIFPQIGPTPVQLQNLTINVQQTSSTSPD